MPVKGRTVDTIVEIQTKANPPFPLDLLVRTPASVKQRLEWGDCFLREILAKGEVLYESAHG